MNPAQKGEGFSGQRIIVLLRSIVARAQSERLTTGLVPTDAGYFPRAVGHLRRRDEGIDQAIFIYCVEGAGWCELAGERRKVQAGKLLVIPPNTPHAYGAARKKPWTIYWFHAKGNLLPDFLAGLNVSPAHPLVFLGDDPQVLAVFEELLEVLGRGSAPQQMLHASHALAHLLALMIRHRHESWRVQPDSRQKISQTIGYMKLHLSGALQLDTLARLAGLSRSRYSALFKEQTGCAPMDYFNRLRMQRACQMLDATGLSVKAVAARLGYEDPLYFSRVFRSVTEMSPVEYRRTHKG